MPIRSTVFLIFCIYASGLLSWMYLLAPSPFKQYISLAPISLLPHTVWIRVAALSKKLYYKMA